MLTASKLLKAQHVRSRALQRNCKALLEDKEPIIIDGKTGPKKALVSLDDLLELFEMIDDLQDKALIELVRESRDAAARGDKPIPVSKLFKQIRGKK